MSYTTAGDARSRRVLWNVTHGLAARGVGLLLLFYSTSLMLKAMGMENFGLWLVVLGVLQWVVNFDFGVSFGARNELARNVAHGDFAAAARTVTTGYLYCIYVAMALGAIGCALLLTPLNSWLTDIVFSGHDMGDILLLCLLAFLANFVLGFVQQVYAAIEQGAAASVYSLLVNLLLVLALEALPEDVVVGIPVVAAVYCVAMILPNLIMSIWLYSRYSWLRPRAVSVDHGLRPIILGVGLPLFVIQLCALVIFSTDRLIVSAAVGPRAVVVYDAAFKIFGVLTMAHGLVMGVLWSSFTQAYTTGDWPWIRRVLNRLQLFMLPLGLGSLILVVASPGLVRWWLGDVAVGSTALYMGFAVYTLLSSWSNVWAYFLNGVGEVRVQMFSSLCAAVLNVPLSFWFARGLGLGEAGVVWGTVVSLCFFSVIGPLESARFIRNEAARS